MRVLSSTDIPEDPVEYVRVKKIVLRAEAMFMDDFEAIVKGVLGMTINW